jgi:tetratricopeptide (TPR) repeat protein
MTQWLPIHSLKLETYGSILKTFRQAFPHASLWYTKDYTILLGTLEPLKIDVQRLERSMAAPRVKKDLSLAFFDDPVELLSTFVMQGKGIEAMTSQYKINTDDLPHSAFPGLELRTDPEILRTLVRYREPVLEYLEGLPPELEDGLKRGAAATDALIMGHVMKALELNPESGRMKAYAREAREYGEYLVQKLQYYPGNAQLMREAAGALIERGEHARAVKILEGAIEIEPDSAGGWYLLGTSARRAGRAKRAEEALTRAVEMAPGHWRAWKELGMLQLERGKPRKARASLEKVLELRPDDPKAAEILNQLQKRGF